MKILKTILIVLICFIAIVLIVALFLDKGYNVEREIIINKPRTEVFNFIKLLKNQEKFSFWALKDPNMKKEVSGQDGTIGAVYIWESQLDDLGSGEQEIIEMVEGEKINYELRFKKPVEFRGHTYFGADSMSGNTTIVKWGLDGKMDYPMNLRILFLNMDKILGEQLQIGLNNLKKELEK